MLSKTVKKAILYLLVMTFFTMPTITVFASETKPDNEKNILESEPITNEYDKREAELSNVLPMPLEEISDNPDIGVDELKRSILKEDSYTDGLAIKHAVRNIDIFKSALQLKYPTMSEIEVGKMILMSLGDSEDFVATLPEEKIIEAIGYISVTQTISFFQQTADGLKMEISEQDYYSAVSQIEGEQHTNDSKQSDYGISVHEGVYDEVETKDSYIKVTSTAYKRIPSYAVTGRNYFTLRGEVEWTKTPFFQGKDVLAIASSGNVDDSYTSSAYASWSNGLQNDAAINRNGGKGEKNEDTLKIYNPGVNGIAVEVQVGLSNEGPVLKCVYAYYGISTQNDVTCQVGYAHKTLGFGGPNVSIDYSGLISFSVGLASSMETYYGRAFTLYHEYYAVSLTNPTHDEAISYTSAAPTFEWDREYGFPEQYILEIDYLGDGTGKYMRKYVSDRTDYTLSQSDWQTIINNASFTGTVKKIRWRITINYTRYPLESYHANWKSFTITGVPLTTKEELTIYGHARYTEKIIHLGAGGYKDFSVTFRQSGTQLIQTFGDKDTVIELYSSSDSLLTRNDDGGYKLNGLLTYYFQAGVKYKIRVRLFGSSTYGDTKLAITPACGVRKTDKTSITNYEDIYAVENYTAYNWGTYAEPNYTRVITYKTASSGSYNFEIESNFDTYIYVIDPRSNTAITENVNYNDDGGEGLNPSLTTHLNADVPYLIIYCAYNPSTLTETMDLTLKIRKQ